MDVLELLKSDASKNVQNELFVYHANKDCRWTMIIYPRLELFFINDIDDNYHLNLYAISFLNMTNIEQDSRRMF